MKETYLDELNVTLHLVIGDEWVDSAEFRPRERDHATRAIKLHRAASKRDHRMNETKILRLQVINVPHHLSLRVMSVENRMRKDFGSPAK